MLNYFYIHTHMILDHKIKLKGENVDQLCIKKRILSEDYL